MPQNMSLVETGSTQRFPRFKGQPIDQLIQRASTLLPYGPDSLPVAPAAGLWLQNQRIQIGQRGIADTEKEETDHEFQKGPLHHRPIVGIQIQTDLTPGRPETGSAGLQTHSPVLRHFLPV